MTLLAWSVGNSGLAFGGFDDGAFGEEVLSGEETVLWGF